VAEDCPIKGDSGMAVFYNTICSIPIAVAMRFKVSQRIFADTAVEIP